MVNIIKSCARILILLNIILFFNNPANAVIVDATSCSQSDIQSAVNSAKNGDTIFVPSGNCTWNSTVTIPDTKGLQILGAGIGKTVITGSGNPKFLIQIAAASGTFTRISGIEFESGSGQAVFIAQTTEYGAESVRRYRIDNCKFDYHKGIGLSGNAYGVVDNCEFKSSSAKVAYILWIDGKTGRQRQGFSTSGSYDFGWQCWEEGVKFGSEYFHTVEDCIFTFDTMGDSPNWVDGKLGGKLLFRFNRLANGTIPGGHDACANYARGFHAVEMYNNEYISDEHNWTMNNNRGGAWLIYDNIFRVESLGQRHALTFSNPVYRYPSSGGCQGVWSNPCDSVNTKFCIKSLSPCSKDSDCNEVSGDTCENIDTNAYPCRDQIGIIDNSFTRHPLVSWNNLWCEGSSDCTPTEKIGFLSNDSRDYEIIKFERDVIDDVSGSGGVPVCEDGIDNDGDGGLDSSTDSTCQDYWDSTSNKLKGYSALSYPHPLRGEVLSPPKNLRILGYTQ